MSAKKIFWLLIFICLKTTFSLAQKNKNTVQSAIKEDINKAVEEFNNTQYDKALLLAKNALVKSFSINDLSYISQSYNTIGVIFDECSDSKSAIKYYKKALHYATLIDNDTLQNWIYSNLGSTYYYNNLDTKKGIEYYEKAIHFAEKIKDSSQIIHTKLNLAGAYLTNGDFIKAKRILKPIENRILKNGTDDIKLSYYIIKGIENTNLNKPELAQQFYAKAKDIAIKNDLQSFILNIYENQIKHYQKYNDDKLLSFYQSKYDSLYHELYSSEKLSNLDSQKTAIELDEYKNQLEKIEEQREDDIKKLQTSKLVLILFVIIVITLLLLLLTLYKSIKTREKLNDELTRINEELTVAKEKAETASKLKSQFVSTITHELRTPLYGVIGITNILIDEHKELAESPHLKSLKFSAKYLLSLVNDVLQINKIEEKKLKLENLIFNLADEIETVKSSVEFIADKNNNKLIIEIDTAIPEFLIGDKLRLSQIIMNLVSNSLKFTKNGEVSVIADLDRVEGSKYYIAFQVKDNGVGIAKEDQINIFEKFVQIERKEEDYQGTGLGLSIVSNLIKLFGSEIHLESELNVGTTFSFTIGFVHDEEKSQEIINNIEVDLSTSNPINILVIEDNKINQLVTKKIIQGSNLNCTIVDDGYAALVALERDKFDLVLMDINMPLINGFETTRKIREKGITIPVIALTAFDKQEVSDEAFASGMNDILIKPFEPSKLFQIISSHIQKKESEV